MTIALLWYGAGILIGGAALSEWSRTLASDGATWRGWQRSAAAGIASLIAAVALNWILSWLGALDRPALLVGSTICGALGIVTFARRLPILQFLPRGHLLLLLPLGLWLGFVLWRGSVVPVLSHDALAYHMPKAVMLARAHQFEFFPAPDPRISTSPTNYEMLLADVLLLTGSDAVTEWVGTATYVLLLLVAGALIERWWGDGLHVPATVLLFAATPVVILHSGAHKNDLMSNALYLGALLWGAQWISRGDLVSLGYALLCIGAGAGTKLQTVFVAAALAIVALWAVVRRQLSVDRAQVVTLISAVAFSVALLGGWVYIANIAHTGQAAIPASESVKTGYGDWTNILEVPLLQWLRPFDRGIQDLFVPWRHARWFWPKYEIYFSDYGAVISVLALLLPWTARRYRRRWLDQSTNNERIAGTVAAGLAIVMMLPLRLRPLGFFAGFPRYYMFAAAYVLAWTIAPVIREVVEQSTQFAQWAILIACVAMFMLTACIYTLNDTFQPFAYVLYIAGHRGDRTPAFAGYRAGTIADRFAGPRDTIAIDGGFESWIYPLYGSSLERKVVFIDSPMRIPDDAQWIVVDRSWNTVWGQPDFQNTGQWRTHLGHGVPSAEDVAVLRRLLADPGSFKPVYFFPARNQAVFKRLHPASPPPPVAGPGAGSAH